MNPLIINESTRFLFAFSAGVTIMIFYDIFTLPTQKTIVAAWVFHVFDTLFILSSCCIILFVTLTTSDGTVRVYEWIAAFCGGILYKFLISSWFCLVFKKLMNGILKFFQLFFEIVLTPLYFLYKIMNKCIVVFYRVLIAPFVAQLCMLKKLSAKHRSPK